jgi:hypothetical protein
LDYRLSAIIRFWITSLRFGDPDKALPYLFLITA